MPRNPEVNKYLIPVTQQTPERAHEMRVKGGKSRAKQLKARLSFKNQLIQMLTEDPEKQKKILESLLNNAAKGNKDAVKAFEVLRDTIGEKPIDKVVSQITSIDIDLGETDADKPKDTK